MSARHDAPDLPRVPVPDTSELRQTAYDAFANKDTHTPEGEREDEARPLQGSPVIASRPPRRPSVSGSHSHVELDHFDPDGMTALRRTMSRASESVAHPGRSPVLPVARPTSQTSDATLAAGDGPFDFEKTLRYFVQR
jgi:ATP-binding cassette subfamily G (WHITE) protein 2 (SNQ2)